MALNSPAITAAIHAAGPDILGLTFPILAGALGAAVSGWVVLPVNFALAGVTVGAIGAGTSVGKLFVAPNPGPMASTLVGAGVVGVIAPRVGSAVALGIANSFSSLAQYAGVSTGVGVGTDLSVVAVVNIPSLIAAISASFGGSGIVGPTAAIMASAFGTGIGLTLAAAVTVPGTGIVSGGVPGAPSTGVSFSSVF